MFRFWQSFCITSGIITALLCAPMVLRAQSVRTNDLGVGKLLVAREADRRFAETVILLVEHDSQGALGLTINRRTTEPIAEALPELPGASGWSEPVYLGGPVEATAVFALLRSRDKQEEMKPVVNEIYWATSRPVLEKILANGPAVANAHIYLGYSGWGAGQLENEVRSWSWYIFDGSADLVFDSDPASLWSRLKARTEQRLAYQTIPTK